MSEPIDKWHRCQIDRTLLKALLKRTNWHGLVYLFYFITLLLITGALALLSIGTLWSIPAFLLFGGIWVFATSVAHETAHGTPFKNHTLNESVLFVSGLMVQQTPCLLRYVHSHHHSHTALAGDDPEIILTNPITPKDFILKALIDIGSVWYFIRATVLLALHRPGQDAVRCIPVKKNAPGFYRSTNLSRHLYRYYCLVTHRTVMGAHCDVHPAKSIWGAYAWHYPRDTASWNGAKH